MANMLISTMSGEESNNLGMVKFHQFVVPSRDFPIAKEHFIWQIARGVDPKLTIDVAGRVQIIPAAPNTENQSLHGQWTTSAYAVPQGLILKLFCQKKVAAEKAPVNSCVYIRMREGAPLVRVSAILTGWAKCAYIRANVEGRFDILDGRGLKMAGVEITPLVFRNIDPAIVGRCFEITVMDRASSGREVHEVQAAVTEDGKVTAVAVARPGRVLDI